MKNTDTDAATIQIALTGSPRDSARVPRQNAANSDSAAQPMLRINVMQNSRCLLPDPSCVGAAYSREPFVMQESSRLQAAPTKTLLREQGLQPAHLLQVRVQPGADHHHHADQYRIAVPTRQLRHVHEVHSVPTGD